MYTCRQWLEACNFWHGILLSHLPPRHRWKKGDQLQIGRVRAATRTSDLPLEKPVTYNWTNSPVILDDKMIEPQKNCNRN